MAHPQPLFHVGIEISRSACRRIERDLKMPLLAHWRLHWYGNPGAGLWWRRRLLATGPEQLLVIAPQTPFERRMTGPVDQHLFAHFRLDPGRNHATNRIWSFPCTTAQRALIAELLCDLPADGMPTVTAPWRAAALVLSALERFTDSDWPAAVGDVRIQEALRRIESDLAFPIDNRRLAQQVGMSTSGFVRRFTSEMGITPQRHVTRRRIELACQLLQLGTYRIDEVSAACGYCDRTYFTTVFTAAVGLTPAAYRRRMADSDG
jgi:AraC-like DNA-binding protein